MRVFITNSDSPLEENFEKVLFEFEREFENDPISFGEADIMTGASCGALLVELKEWLPLILPAASVLFFTGKSIEENLEAWGKIGVRIKSLFDRLHATSAANQITVDNQLASLIAVSHLIQEVPSDFYRLLNIFGINGYLQEVIDCTIEEVEEQHISTFFSYHCIFHLDHLRFYSVTVGSNGTVLGCAALNQTGND